MNKKGIAQLVIFGIPVTVIIIFLFQIWAANEIYDALEPELQKAMIELGDAIVCPPELNTGNFEVCINKDGKVIANGKIDERINLEINSNGKIDSCIIHMGEYIDKKTCRIDDFHILENFDIQYTYKATTMRLNSKNLEFYVFNSKNLKIPIKKWKGIWRVIRYIPK